MAVMKAIVFEGNGVCSYTDREIPQIVERSDMLVKVLACSICGSDVHITAVPPGIAAKPGIILGHEFVGEVVETGPGVRGFQAGDHLICDNNIPCGVCPACQAGKNNLCMNMNSMGSICDGVFAGYVVIPEQNAAKIPASLPVEKAIFAEPLNCVMGALKNVRITPGATVLILGGGPIGMYFASLCKLRGAYKVIVSEPQAFRARHCLQAGADVIADPGKEDIVKTVEAQTNGLGADLVIDAVGCLVADAIRCAKINGTVVLFGLNANAREEIRQVDITYKGLTLVGTYIGDHTLYDTAQLLQTDLLDFSHMITHRLPLERFEEGMAAMRNGSGIEVVLYP